MSDFARQIQLEDEEIKIIIAILRFSSSSCPLEHILENKIELKTVNNLVSKFEETLKYILEGMFTSI
jgi:hypothetical protein